jgi:hypothetical protein
MQLSASLKNVKFKVCGSYLVDPSARMLAPDPVGTNSEDANLFQHKGCSQLDLLRTIVSGNLESVILLSLFPKNYRVIPKACSDLSMIKSLYIVRLLRSRAPLISSFTRKLL